jgi:hypothetical protein
MMMMMMMRTIHAVFFMGIEVTREQIRGDLVWHIICARKNSTGGPGNCFMCCNTAPDHLGRVKPVASGRSESFSLTNSLATMKRLYH